MRRRRSGRQDFDRRRAPRSIDERGVRPAVKRITLADDVKRREMATGHDGPAEARLGADLNARALQRRGGGGASERGRAGGEVERGEGRAVVRWRRGEDERAHVAFGADACVADEAEAPPRSER